MLRTNICRFPSCYALPTLIFSLLLALSAPTLRAQATAPPAAAPAAKITPAPKNDYSNPDKWICRPGRHDSCTVDLDSTSISADGKLTQETYTPNPNAPIDCFYLYPTVDTGEFLNSDMLVKSEQRGVVRAQFARFGAQCRLYAPLYRQITLAALRQILTGSVAPDVLLQSRALAYGDVLDAWHYYLEHDNQGRGVVLVGHSQGANLLVHLLKDEVDGKPVQSRLVSALLLGTNFSVPKGKDVGGELQHIPLCHSPTQTGCVITYVSFRTTAPPPEDGRFGHVKDPHNMAGCTNPAALAGGSGELRADLPSNDKVNVVHDMSSHSAWVNPPVPISTPFVSLPGMLTAECVANEHGSYLAVTIHDTPNGARAHDIGGDLVVDGNLLSEWGLHLIDVNLALGNLVDIVGQQSKAYIATAAKN